MDSMDYWRLCDELSVLQSALLIVGEDPGGDAYHVETWQVHQRPLGYEAAKAALVNAILSGRLPATIRRRAWERGWDEDAGEGEHFALGDDQVSTINDAVDASRHRDDLARRGIIYRAEPDWASTTIRVDRLQTWLSSRGFRTGFFFPAKSSAPDYLDPNNLRYAPKLAAAVKAWQAVTDANGKSPKQALEKWLREHAAEFGLSDDEGKPNETGIMEASKVANWQPGGGAPKTPGT
jgi:hypothetical protein